MTSRETESLQKAPPADALVGGPTRGDFDLARVCDSRHPSPWFFSSDGGGRFDPVGESDFGACYWASSWMAAVREALGPDYRPGAVIARSWFDQRCVWSTRPDPDDPPLIADLLNAHWTAFGLTSELWTRIKYGRPQKWGAAFLRAGYDGMLHGLRHVLTEADFGVTVFGPAGAQPHRRGFTNVERTSFDDDDCRAFAAETNVLVEATPVPPYALHVIS